MRNSFMRIIKVEHFIHTRFTIVNWNCKRTFKGFFKGSDFCIEKLINPHSNHKPTGNVTTSYCQQTYFFYPTFLKEHTQK